MFEEFEKDSQGKGRGRFSASLATSILFCTGVFGGLIVASAAARSTVQEEELTQVEFAIPEEAPPPPPVEAPPPPPVERPKPRKTELEAPEEIPDEKAAEADGPLADAPVQDAPVVAAPAPGPAVVEAPAPPPPVRPKPSGPVQLPEQATPPVAVAGNTPPAYPEEARKAGVQAVVIAKIVIRENGTVSSVEVLRGPEIFHASVKAALMTWHYEPARLPDGTAISVFRIVQLPFKLENM